MTKARSVTQIIEEQMHRWQIMQAEKPKESVPALTITISREPGSRSQAARDTNGNGSQSIYSKILQCGYCRPHKLRSDYKYRDGKFEQGHLHYCCRSRLKRD